MVDVGVSLLTFPNGLWVRGDVYGTTWPLAVEGHVAEVRLPRYNVDSPGTRDHWPTEPDLPEAERLSKALSDDEHRVQWGSRYQYHPEGDLTQVAGEVDHAALVVTFPEATTDPAERQALADRAGEAAEEWCAAMVKWLSVLHLSDVDPGYFGIRITNRKMHTSDQWLHQPAGGTPDWEWLRPTSPRVIAIAMSPGGPSYGMFATTPDEWSKANELVAQGSEIPPEWQLLDSAFDACLNDSFRVAALDAATALELVLVGLVRSHFGDSIPEKSLVAILKRVGPLGRLKDFVHELGYAVPRKELQTKVVTLRNRVAHANYSAERDETADALRMVREMLNTYAPLT